jgi:hypothetical protein
MISVRDLGDGTYAVIDGIQRVTTLQTLRREGHPGIKYDQVIHSIVIIPSACQLPVQQLSINISISLTHVTYPTDIGIGLL